MANNRCAKCGHGYGSKVHQTQCAGKTVIQFRAESRAAYRHQRGSTTYRRSTAEILASGRQPITINAVGNVERGIATETNLQAMEAQNVTTF